MRQAVSEHTLIHEAGGLPNRVRELLKPYEFLADDCGERVILKLDLDEAMELISGALEVAEAQSDGRGKALRYIAFVLAGDEQEDAQLAADRAKGELAALRALERELRSGKNVDGIVMALGVLDQVRRDLKR